MNAVNQRERCASGDFLIDLLQATGIWPSHLDPMAMGRDTPVPDSVVDACRLLPEVRRSKGEPVLRHPPIRPWTPELASSMVRGLEPPGTLGRAPHDGAA